MARNDSRPDADAIFRPIVGARAFAEVVDQLTYAVRSGRLSVGDRLPTLDDLARMMKVSKPTVGEAVRVLADAQVLRVRRGATGGVDVVSPKIPAETLRLSTERRARRFSELVDARRSIEYELARLACQRATHAELEEMDELAIALETAEPTSHAWERANSLFHYSIGRAARSELLAFYQHQVLEEIAIFFGAFPPRYSDPRSTIAAHRQTIDALFTRDPEQVRAAMVDHLADLESVGRVHDPREKA